MGIPVVQRTRHLEKIGGGRETWHRLDVLKQQMEMIDNNFQLEMDTRKAKVKGERHKGRSRMLTGGKGSWRPLGTDKDAFG